MKRKGFTLIELLAVIVVLVIIALIATPIVMNTIEKSKKGAAERTADSYVRAVETDIATSYVVDGFYGEVSETIPVEVLNDMIEIKGDKPTKGWVEVEQGVVVDYKLKIGDYTVTYDKEKKTGVATKIEDVETPSIIYRWSIDTINIGDTISIEDEFSPFPLPSGYTTDPSTLGKSYYLKHVLDKDGKVTQSYACAVLKGKEYCLTNIIHGMSDNESELTGNALILKNFKDTDGLSCDLSWTGSSCYDGDVYLTAISGNHAVANDGYGRCRVEGSDGRSYCVNR